MGSNWKDQQALVLSIHGTEVTVITVLFTAKYMDAAMLSDSDLCVFEL